MSIFCSRLFVKRVLLNYVVKYVVICLIFVVVNSKAFLPLNPNDELLTEYCLRPDRFKQVKRNGLLPVVQELRRHARLGGGAWQGPFQRR
jgi:hypothetical protein